MPDGDRVRVRMTAGGQVTLPNAVLARHGWAEGTELELVDGPGGIELRQAEKPAFASTRPEDVFGMLKPYYDGPPKTIEEMNAGVEEEFRRQHALGRY